MKDNVAMVLVVLILGLVELGFVAAGIYALLNGFMKTGGFLIVVSGCALIGTHITKKDDEKDRG